MRLRYGFLCDYARELTGGTNMVVGIFDRMVIQRQPGGPLAIMPHVLYVVVEDSSVSPPRHLMGFRLVDADGATVFEQEMPFNIGAKDGSAFAGIPKAGNVVSRVGAILVGDVGAFEWVITVDGERLGSVPFTLAEPQPALA